MSFNNVPSQKSSTYESFRALFLITYMKNGKIHNPVCKNYPYRWKCPHNTEILVSAESMMIGHPDTSHRNNCHSRESNDPFDMTTMTGEVRTGLVVVVSHGRQHSYTCEKMPCVV